MHMQARPGTELLKYGLAETRIHRRLTCICLEGEEGEERDPVEFQGRSLTRAGRDATPQLGRKAQRDPLGRAKGPNLPRTGWMCCLGAKWPLTFPRGAILAHGGSPSPPAIGAKQGRRGTRSWRLPERLGLPGPRERMVVEERTARTSMRARYLD